MSDAAWQQRLLDAARQQQFLEVVDRDVAEARFRQHLKLAPLGQETVPLAEALGRVLARDVVSTVDVPGFDRSRMDGFAVRSSDLAEASAEHPCRLTLNEEILTPGVVPTREVQSGTATVIATGGMIPRGADAVAIVEQTEANAVGDGIEIVVYRSVTAGANLATAGSDIAQGETVLRAGQTITSREVGSLAAIGVDSIAVWRRPQVGIFSTGDEIVAIGGARPLGRVYDSNSAVFAAAVREAGGEPVMLGIAPDDEPAIRLLLDRALAYDMVILSGGTSKGAGDVAYRVVSQLRAPGIVVHGVALKPGKPLCLAVADGKPVIVLPGFPTSAIFTFHEFVAPVIRAYAGLPPERVETLRATVPTRMSSDRGRTEYVMVSLIRDADGALVAYPSSKGSGAVTAFGQADGFFAIPAQVEAVAAGSPVEVTLIGARHALADLVIIGSHCVGLDHIIGRMMAQGFSVRSLNVGSSGGLAAARRGECDLAGIHLMDAQSGVYNRPFLSEGLELLTGYRRMQGVVFRHGDVRFEGRSAAQAAAAVANDASCIFINRNAGSGTRILIDQLLGGKQPAGYLNQAKTHNAVAAAVAQGRADWGCAIETVARQYDLGFLPMREEHYDFVVPASRLETPAVRLFRSLLDDVEVRRELQKLGFQFAE